MPRGQVFHLERHDCSSVPCPNAERACAEEAVWPAQSVLLAERADMDDIVTAIEKVRSAR